MFEPKYRDPVNKQGITIVSLVNFKVIGELETKTQSEEYDRRLNELRAEKEEELKKDKNLIEQLQRDAIQYALTSKSKTAGEEQKKENHEFIPKCPTCGSPNVERIMASNKVKNAILFGVFSIGHLSKTYKCNSCLMKW